MDVFDPDWVDERIGQTVSLWERCSKGPIHRGRRYSRREQGVRERAYDRALEAVEQRYQRNAQKPENNGPSDQMISLFSRFAAEAMGLPHDAIDLLTQDFFPVGAELGRQARRFDPNLGMGEIIQAARNAWTACGLQPLFGTEVLLTPAIFGYSMIYPYSDNLLDDESIDAGAKRRFSQRLLLRLSGEPSPAETDLESCLWNLVSMIEGQYPRKHFPQVFECLLRIHHAQEQSIEQLVGKNAWNATDILRLSCAKGGTSVLADACLVRGWLAPEESLFAFEWGVLLQLGDDLQDLKDDRRRGSQTLFTLAASAGKDLDDVAIQLFRLAQSVGARMDKLSNGTLTLKQLLKTSWESLILRAIADSHEFFSASFLREAEALSPFRFEFLRSRSNRLASQQGLYATVFEDLLQTDLRVQV